MHVHTKKSWEIEESRATPEHVYWDRRRFLKSAALAGFGLAGARRALCVGEGDDAPVGGAEKSSGPYPAPRNESFRLDRPLTPELYATSYNNFYEFSFSKTAVRELARALVPSPWKLEIAGLVRKPVTLDVDDLVRTMPLEERLYRFRCVEAWAMAVPWTGFPLSVLLDRVEPLKAARYVRFVSFNEPRWARNLTLAREYPWPYFEGLSIEEARNELTLLATGLYGKPLPNQNGAPVRLVVPWKYGFKSIKSIVRIELVAEKPPTFWNAVLPEEYGFLANVDPAKPHPRWSQATERMIDTGERRPTLVYNGYAEQVAKLYG